MTLDWPWTLTTPWGACAPVVRHAQHVTYPAIPIGPRGVPVTLHVIRRHHRWHWQIPALHRAGTGYATPKAALIAACQVITEIFGGPCAITTAPRADG
ncbi:hypothetical protein [Sulfobacillus sp. hq2]|uniref:hypothetical protein n=1 Tax=Sulfobacillus sp. hq2 TaxID=2039167 RepID=UPI000CD02B8A|nr:hypothetical protein [Sulfobacillus sp. hq2]POB12206.1 hypothetical protein CO251_00840 [Sulfobacillus sp. hq2]